MRTTSRVRASPLAALVGCLAVVLLGPPAQRYDDAAARPVPEVPRLTDRQVLAISVDGLHVRALRTLGNSRTPHLHRLLRQGARTLNARTQVELTVTLPNHTSMLTGRRVDASHGGHGVTWNTDLRGLTVHEAAGEHVSSVFEVVHAAGGGTALFAAEQKFTLFRRSWSGAIDRTGIVQDGDAVVVRMARRDLVRRDRAFTFLHLGLPDEIGHQSGWMSRRYLRAVERVDGMIGNLLSAVRRHPALSDLVIVLTADHGGLPDTTHHDDATRLDNYRVPFVIRGPGVEAGNLYAMNPSYADPARARVGFRGAQPIRNGDLANLCADLLGLGPVPGSRWDADQQLRWSS